MRFKSGPLYLIWVIFLRWDLRFHFQLRTINYCCNTEITYYNILYCVAAQISFECNFLALARGKRPLNAGFRSQTEGWVSYFYFHPLCCERSILMHVLGVDEPLF